MAGGGSVQLPRMTLPLNTLTPYLRAHLEVCDNTLRWDSWWTALGFVPTRRDHLVLALADVSASRVRVGVHWDRLLVATGLVVSALAWMQGWGAAAALAGAILLLVMAPTAQLCVTPREGRTRRLSLCILHRLDVELAAMALDDLTGRRVGRTRRGSRPPDPPVTGPATT